MSLDVLLCSSASSLGTESLTELEDRLGASKPH